MFSQYSCFFDFCSKFQITNNEGKRGVFIFVNQKQFAKLLQENEARVYWKSDTAPECYIVHEWRLIDGDRCLLREYQRHDGSIYWANKDKLKG